MYSYIIKSIPTFRCEDKVINLQKLKNNRYTQVGIGIPIFRQWRFYGTGAGDHFEMGEMYPIQ